MAKMLIAGEQVDSESKETTQVRNPATGEVVDSVPKGTIGDIQRAINAAQGRETARWNRKRGQRS